MPPFPCPLQLRQAHPLGAAQRGAVSVPPCPPFLFRVKKEVLLLLLLLLLIPTVAAAAAAAAAVVIVSRRIARGLAAFTPLPEPTHGAPAFGLGVERATTRRGRQDGKLFHCRAVGTLHGYTRYQREREN